MGRALPARRFAQVACARSWRSGARGHTYRGGHPTTTVSRDPGLHATGVGFKCAGPRFGLVRSARTSGRGAYVPVRFLPPERISTADKLLLAFDAFVLSQACDFTPPHLGKLIHGRQYVTTTVPLNPLYAKVQSVFAAIAAQHASATPPPLVLNKHCAECQYASYR